MNNKLSVLIITYNEEKNVENCIQSVQPIASEIVIIDSESTDKTVEFAKNTGAKVFVHKWQGYVIN